MSSVVSMSNFVRQNILNGRKLFVASNRLECKFLVLAVLALALTKLKNEEKYNYFRKKGVKYSSNN